jgi:RimJ/RimL family protein N-acetyltransferase
VNAATSCPAPAGPRGTVPGIAAWGRTPRLALSEFTARDHADLLRMHQDARVRALLVDDYPLDDPAVLRLFLSRMALLYRQHEGCGIWRADVPAAHGGAAPEFAGWFSLMPMAGRPGEVELGSRLLPGAWGRGVVFDGTELLLEHAFERLSLAGVWATCHPDNRSARAVLLALGFDALGLRPYDGREASHFHLDAPAWRAARGLPRRERLRRALRRAPAAPASAIPTEETAA